MLTALAAYLVGSIPTGYLFARARGVDIRSVGSGNIGATNVFRVLGKTAGILVLLIDAVKGFVPARFFLFGATPETQEYHAIVAGLFAILGHNYTCWLRFKGGKGIATSAGVVLALVPLGLLITVGVWLVVFALSRYVSLASVVAAAILPLAIGFTGQSTRMILLGIVLGALAIYKHKSNIQRLLAGTEHRFGAKKEDR
ncbi:MAG TPA: glycerol-3-phosphate 1-O-acyltransferase PlsY [Verrucomicrobiae bacterium]|nr:glycerol-3-phosphate 1-O-acyltransferase PlsY [Verrucomicrobiae bacterium]